VPPPTVPDREPILLHAIEGEHFAHFDANTQRAFFDTVWKIGPESNRMGFRLTGATLQRMNGAANNGASGGTNGAPAAEILSGPTALGSVQVPANGTPIALMADHQTTGGYPRIAEIASADVPRLAQLGPNGSLHFARCSLELAAELRRDLKNRLEPALRAIAWEYGK
jgi:antagonist of KipI